jgi:hypothetical protein
VDGRWYVILWIVEMGSIVKDDDLEGSKDVMQSSSTPTKARFFQCSYVLSLYLFHRM